MAGEKICFVIAPIGEDGSIDRKRTEDLLEHILSPAVNRCGYNALAAHKLPDPGSITSQIIHYLSDAPLVIADMTDHNANVFYELAIRHALKKPIVHLIEAGQRRPFDVGDVRTIPYRIELEAIAKAREQVVEQIQFLQAHPVVETPISKSLDLQLNNPDLVLSFDDKKSDLTTGEKTILRFIEQRITMSYDSIPVTEIEGHLKRTSCVYWRLQNLCSLGFLQKERTGTRGGKATYNYRLTSAYRKNQDALVD